MAKVVDTQEFSRNGRKGTLFTIQVRGFATTAGTSAKALLTARFPRKAQTIEVLGVEQFDDFIGAMKVYEVDVFVPFGDMEEPQTPSGDIDAGSMV